MRNIIFIAPPAAGKGTVSDYLKKNYNYEHLSTGDLLRDEIKSESKLGKEIDQIISSGQLVSDELMIKLVAEKLNSLDKNKPFVLDGFPRTLNQAYKLDEMFSNLNISNNMVIYLTIDLDEATKRVLGRIICPKCKRSYNINFEGLKPLIENICDDCGIELEKRSDDDEKTFKVRFDSYLDNISPILDYYKEKDLLISVDATSDLSKKVEQIIKEAKND